jgi:penicillin amidase
MPIALGNFLAPQEGFWQNAEPMDYDFSDNLHFNNLKGNVDVYFDDRLVPHVFADHENDAYFVQGYLHAKFRLWQMEFQTFAAAGRASEVVGSVALNHDREFRRLGMVYAAENSLAEIEKDPETKSVCDAYTSGVNAYISTLTKSSLPLEYKLLGYQPEKWTNLKTSLFLKYMTFDLAGHENDFEMTQAKSFFTKSDFDKLFPVYQDSTVPIVAKGTAFPDPKISPKAPDFADSIYFNFLKETTPVSEVEKPNPNNGSNNWAVDSSKTASHAPILCNDPHLGLNLPSLWYEIQISTPHYNAYGVSFPGAPGVIIGFNDSCAFGFTNGGRDVRDYYEIKFKDDSKKEYWYDSSWIKTSQRIENIKVAGQPDFVDTVAYTVFGPVMYDRSFQGKGERSSGKAYAVKWEGHENSNELKFFYLLDRAKNYEDYLNACNYLKAPGQNCVFACKKGDIAIRAQGHFPAKWNGQGDFLMPGFDSSYCWQGMIPDDETPFEHNPSKGYVSSANQRPVDNEYPYYLGREYPSARGIYLNKQLSSLQNITVNDMMVLQSSNQNIFAEMILPLFLKNINEDALLPQQKKYYNQLKQWNGNYDNRSTAATCYELTWKNFYDTCFNDEYLKAPKNTMRPFESTLLESILKDSTYKFIDNIYTFKIETLKEIILAAFYKAVDSMSVLESEGKAKWGVYKDAHIDHILKIPEFSRQHLDIGGVKNALNASNRDHGPSWKMVVNLTASTEAFGIYPGGQSGNPGSRFYNNSIDKWAGGEYYQLWLMRKEENNDSRIKWKMSFSYR